MQLFVHAKALLLCTHPALFCSAYDLEDKVVGTVGAGRIGRRVLQRLKVGACPRTWPMNRPCMLLCKRQRLLGPAAELWQLPGPEPRPGHLHQALGQNQACRPAASGAVWQLLHQMCWISYWLLALLLEQLEQLSAATQEEPLMEGQNAQR